MEVQGTLSALLGTMIPLAQVASRKDEAVFNWFLMFAGLIVAVLVAGVAIQLIRRRLLASQESAGAGPHDTWGLEDLRRLRDEGEITIAEYETLRARAIEALRDDAGLVDDSRTTMSSSSASETKPS